MTTHLVPSRVLGAPSRSRLAARSGTARAGAATSRAVSTAAAGKSGIVLHVHRESASKHLSGESNQKGDKDDKLHVCYENGGDENLFDCDQPCRLRMTRPGQRAARLMLDKLSQNLEFGSHETPLHPIKTRQQNSVSLATEMVAIFPLIVVVSQFIIALVSATSSTKGFPWRSVSSDATGQYLVAAGSSGYNLTTIQISNDYGITWTQTSSPQLPWLQVRSDATGKILVAIAGCKGSNFVGCSSPYVSTDRGSTWAKDSSVGDITCSSVTMDSSGTTMYAVCLYADASKGQMTGMFYSGNGGRNWSLKQMPYQQFYNSYSSPLAMAASKAVAYVIEGYVNVNGGSQGWTHGSPNSYGWKSVAIDSSSLNVAAAYSKGLYISADGGKTYSSVSSLGFVAVCSDGAGENMYAATTDGIIYRYQRSSHSLTKTSGKFTAVTELATSVSGQYVVASAGNDGISVSSNYGQSWTAV